MLKKSCKVLWRKLISLGIFQWVIAAIMTVLIWFIYLTSRRYYENYDIFKKYKHKPAVFVFWHGRSMMLSPFVFLNRVKTYAVASRRRDGRLMAKLQHFFGLGAIYGSSNDGGLSVLRKGVRKLRRGDSSICITPDGPCGPSLRVQDGALYFAKMTGVPIIPVCFSASHVWMQNRWDQYLLVYPFTKIKFNIGNPIFVDSNISEKEFESVRKNLEKVMIKQLRDLDSEFNVKPVKQDLNAMDFSESNKRKSKKG
jgi:hypothetical protein